VEQMGKVKIINEEDVRMNLPDIKPIALIKQKEN